MEVLKLSKKIEFLSLLFYYSYKIEKLYVGMVVFGKLNEISIGIGLKKVVIANNFYGEVLEYFINYRCFEGVEFISHG